MHPLLALREGIDHVFDEFSQGFEFPTIRSSFFEPAAFNKRLSHVFGEVFPHVDMSETDKQIELTAELPGLDEKDVSVTLTDGTLNIKGEKKTEKEEKKKNYYMSERSYGSFQRSFPLPEAVVEGKIEAAFDKGVLKVILPKKPGQAAKAKKIQIKKSS